MIVKRVAYDFMWDTSKGQDFRQELENKINEECKQGWVPWNIKEESAFNKAYTNCQFFYSVWYKRDE